MSPNKEELSEKAKKLTKEIEDGVLDEEDIEMFMKFLETKEKRSKLDKDLIRKLKRAFAGNATDNTNENYKKIVKELKDKDMKIDLDMIDEGVERETKDNFYNVYAGENDLGIKKKKKKKQIKKRNLFKN